MEHMDGGGGIWRLLESIFATSSNDESAEKEAKTCKKDRQRQTI